MVVFSFRDLHILSSLPALCVCSRSRSIRSAQHLAWSCYFLCKTLHFTPWIWPLRLLVFLVACSTVDCNSHIEISWNARRFRNPIVDRITVFWNWRGNCNSNNSEIQHQTPFLLTLGKSPNPKRLAFQTYTRQQEPYKNDKTGQIHLIFVAQNHGVLTLLHPLLQFQTQFTFNIPASQVCRVSCPLSFLCTDGGNVSFYQDIPAFKEKIHYTL